MWIFTTTGFVSAVVNNDAPNPILGRARKESALRAFVALTHSRMKLAEQIRHTPDADYAWRVAMPRPQFERAVSTAAEQMDYSNFKAAAATHYQDAQYARILSQLWHDLRKWQGGD